MKRLPRITGFVVFLLLAASIAYWGTQWYRPSARLVAPPPPAPDLAPDLAAASGLFGARLTVTVASNYQLKGVVVAGRAADSVAIIATDGKPAQAIAVNREVSQGVRVKQVFRQYVMLEEGGVAKRLDLPADAKGRSSAEMAGATPPGTGPAMAPQTLQPLSPQLLAPSMPAMVVGQPEGERPAGAQNTSQPGMNLPAPPMPSLRPNMPK